MKTYLFYGNYSASVLWPARTKQIHVCKITYVFQQELDIFINCCTDRNVQVPTYDNHVAEPDVYSTTPVASCHHSGFCLHIASITVPQALISRPNASLCPGFVVSGVSSRPHSCQIDTFCSGWFGDPRSQVMTNLKKKKKKSLASCD